jgi:hypothetical protein
LSFGAVLEQIVHALVRAPSVRKEREREPQQEWLALFLLLLGREGWEKCFLLFALAFGFRLFLKEDDAIGN